MKNKPIYWNTAIKVLSQKDKVLKRLIKNMMISFDLKERYFLSLQSIIGQQIMLPQLILYSINLKKMCKNKSFKSFKTF